jgi:protein-disulfide isomerase
MVSSKFGRSRASVAIAFSLGVASLWAASGCKPRAAGDKSAPVASGSAAAAAASAAAAGPCAQYADKVCAKAGAESPTCTSFKEATNVMSPGACTAGLKDIQVTLTKLAAARGDCEKLVKTLCAAVGPKTKTCTMVTTQTSQFPPARCKQMMEHLPQITEDLKKMEAANQPLPPDVQAAMVNGGAAFGPENSLVKIVEFSDFECPYCSRAASVVHQIKEKYGDKVRFVFRQFPLPMHPNAKVAAEASLAALAQGKFWEFHDELFKNQQALARPQLEEHAKKAGLNLPEFKKALDDKKFGEQVDAEVKLGEKAQVQGTPTMFINGARVENPTDFAAIASLIDAALSGTPPG